jgi:lysine 2,3-aminomutase
LKEIFEVTATIPSVTDIRIHTRVPIFSPAALKSDDKLKLFATYNVRMVLHCVHPYEICDEVGGLLNRMHALGIRLYNHFPLLRHVNDHADVVLALIQKLDTYHVRTLSIYVPEPVKFSAAYRVAYDRMCHIMDEVVMRAPLWLNSFRFCLDSPVGKVRRENLTMRDRASHTLVFMREGARIVYPDFPADMDKAGDLETMLWQMRIAA